MAEGDGKAQMGQGSYLVNGGLQPVIVTDRQMEFRSLTGCCGRVYEAKKRALGVDRTKMVGDVGLRKAGLPTKACMDGVRGCGREDGERCGHRGGSKRIGWRGNLNIGSGKVKAFSIRDDVGGERS